MQIGIVGLPNVGKSTLFNAITKAGAECANYPFCTIEPNVGVVAVPDERLVRLAEMEHPQKVTPATIEFVDIAGLVKGASRGEGLGNKFLSHIREVDAIAHVVRCFDDPNVVHVEGKVDPVRDIETINLELIFSDLELLDRRMDRVKKQSKSGEKQYLQELSILERLKEGLEQNKPARVQEFSEEEQETVKQLFLLTSKPVIYVANISEDDLISGVENDYVKKVRQYAVAEGSEVIPICARIEAELAELPDDEKRELLAEYGLEEPGLNRLIKTGYRLLGLITYLTAGPKEVRAWTIKQGTKAPQAAGKIHSDFERGFIRAEVVAYDDLIACGSQQAARERGLMRSEGKDYVMKDGDVVIFRFNV
ncbi:MAG TPA: redox-regulated ATPase YchF [Thermoanaerobacterales bacterium]|nr:redox-regulated ATPase YchF [Thermoanaerobacterales bacterium]